MKEDTSVKSLKQRARSIAAANTATKEVREVKAAYSDARYRIACQACHTFVDRVLALILDLAKAGLRVTPEYTHVNHVLSGSVVSSISYLVEGLHEHGIHVVPETYPDYDTVRVGYGDRQFTFKVGSSVEAAARKYVSNLLDLIEKSL